MAAVYQERADRARNRSRVASQPPRSPLQSTATARKRFDPTRSPMAIKPNYHEAHLIVAAVRVLSHRDQRPPTPEEVASLLGITSEKVHIVVHELGGLGVLRLLKSPF